MATLFVTNDDGYWSKGIEVLTAIAAEFGDVVVVAPEGPQSGQSSALTVKEHLRLKSLPSPNGVRRYACSGTPVDCVKLGFHEFFLQKMPDILLSGINHGSNSGSSVHYSGTMGATMEGCMKGVSSVGFSLDDHRLDADFGPIVESIRSIIRATLEYPLPQGTCLNVNYPKVDQLKGVKYSRQADSVWTQEYDRRTDPYGKSYYWLTGQLDSREPENMDTDLALLEHGYGTIVPVRVDFTDYEYLNKQSI